MIVPDTPILTGSSARRGRGAGAVRTRPTRSARHRPRRVGPRIAALAVCDSETVFSQDQVLDRLGLRGDPFAEGIFGRSAVTRRHLELSDDFMARTLQARTPQVERELLRRSIGAIEALRLDPGDIGTVISSSLYSLACPTLAHRLVDHYEMDPSTDKYHVTGVGCASAVPLMRLAALSLREHPRKHALVVAAESMSAVLTRATPQDPAAKIVGAAIFGDGCAAALVSSAPIADGPVILASQIHQIGGTLGSVSLDMAGEDSYLHLARDLPDLAGAGLASVALSFLRRNGIDRSRIQHWIVHPGGRRIIENMQAALALSDEDVASSWQVLAEHGNVGTPSILYVLEDTIKRRRPEPGEHALMLTIGPGVTVGMMLLGW